MPNLIDGRAIAERVYIDLRREIAELKAKDITPGLAVSRRRRPGIARVCAFERQNVSGAWTALTEIGVAGINHSAELLDRVEN